MSMQSEIPAPQQNQSTNNDEEPTTNNASWVSDPVADFWSNQFDHANLVDSEIIGIQIAHRLEVAILQLSRIANVMETNLRLSQEQTQQAVQMAQMLSGGLGGRKK